VLENAVCRPDQLSGKRLIERGVADSAIVADHFAFAAEVLAVMAAKTSLSV